MSETTHPLDVRAFTKRYGTLLAVDALSFRVDRGQIVGLVGPNGAGKTTTLRALAGILHPTAGTIHVGGHDIRKETVAAKRALAFVPDTPHPFDAVTVVEHLRFTGMAYRVADAEAKIDRLLGELDLEAKRDALGSTLSRGMRQKLAFGCAFLRDPALLLLDEPLTGLDPKAIRQVREAIRARADAGAAVIVSSHLLDLVERLSDRVIVLAEGRCVADGTLAEIREAHGTHADQSLEEVFFSITEGGRDDAAASPDDAGR